MTSLSWNGRIISIGGRDEEIRHVDVRITTGAKGRHALGVNRFLRCSQSLGSYKYHKHEVCGLKWDGSGRFLASGGNDNVLCLWDIRKTGTSSTIHKDADHGLSGLQFQRRNSLQDAVRETSQPLAVLHEHTAAIKAIDWCPHRSNLLASGGGTLDKKLIIWDINHMKPLASVDTGSQICNLKWSPYPPSFSASWDHDHSDLENIFKNSELELLTSHGFTQNQLSLWKLTPTTASKNSYESSQAVDPLVSMRKLVPLLHLKGHMQRVVHMAIHPNSSMVTTGSGDETIRFWNIFGDKTKLIAD